MAATHLLHSGFWALRQAKTVHPETNAVPEEEERTPRIEEGDAYTGFILGAKMEIAA
jgi:hypothetical protein